MVAIFMLETIIERRSIHNFKEEEIDRQTIIDIFTYGTYAPTHYMKEPWNIKLYQQEGKTMFIDAIMQSYQHIGMITDIQSEKTQKMIQSMKNHLHSIPHHALIYFNREDDPIRYEEEYAAVSAFIQNVQLAAWEFGVGMLWTITPYMHDTRFYEAIGLEAEKVKIAAVLQFGYPKKIPRAKKRTPIENKLEFITE